MTKVRLYPPKPDGTPDINSCGQLIEIEDLPAGAVEFDNIASWATVGPGEEPIRIPNYVAPR